MSSAKKLTLIVLGFFSALLILSQLVMGQLILSGRSELRKAHQHTGYMAVTVSVIYILMSLLAIASLPTSSKPD